LREIDKDLIVFNETQSRKYSSLNQCMEKGDFREDSSCNFIAHFGPSRVDFRS